MYAPHMPVWVRVGGIGMMRTTMAAPPRPPRLVTVYMDMTAKAPTIEELETRRQELVERLEAIKRDYGRGLDQDFEEQAVQLENAEVLREIARVTAEELAKVDRAITALRDR